LIAYLSRRGEELADAEIPVSQQAVFLGELAKMKVQSIA
jgi:hypothetical protein